MTRKDYELIAAVFKSTAPIGCDSEEYASAWELIAERMACALLNDNPRFDLEKFKAATMENLG